MSGSSFFQSEPALLLADPASLSITDPSTADGSVVVFERQVALEVRHSDDNDSNLGTLIAIQVKILVLYDSHNSPESVRVELSRENDLFFSMYHSLQERGFLAMQARQKIMVNFSEYPHLLITNFNKCIKDPSNCMAVLYIHRDGSGRLDIIENLQFKFVELVSLDFLLTPSDIIKQHLLFRYFSMKSQVESLQSRLQEVTDLVKQKSPSLLMAIKKTPMRAATGSGPATHATTAAQSSTPMLRPSHHTDRKSVV